MLVAYNAVLGNHLKRSSSLFSFPQENFHAQAKTFLNSFTIDEFC